MPSCIAERLKYKDRNWAWGIAGLERHLSQTQREVVLVGGEARFTFYGGNRIKGTTNSEQKSFISRKRFKT